MFEFILFYAALMTVTIIGIYIGTKIESKFSHWHYTNDKNPPASGPIKNYPVAFFDTEFGVIMDQAEFHPNSVPHWRTVPDGYACHPYAWYDLPYAPWPESTQDKPIRTGVNDYI
jgi:hypothetical protein